MALWHDEARQSQGPFQETLLEQKIELELDNPLPHSHKMNKP